MLLAYRYRIKSLTGLLNSQARACNFVWNFCNETQQYALKWNKRWPTGFDLNRLTAGSSKELALHAGTINAVCEQYAKSRHQRNRPFLRWRGRRAAASALTWVSMTSPPCPPGTRLRIRSICDSWPTNSLERSGRANDIRGGTSTPVSPMPAVPFT